MKKFNYTMNHKADEAYMAKMCHEGWAATSLVDGVWTFEPCKPDQYVYRVCYLRGKSAAEVEELKSKLAAQGIEFVSRYSFWAIFRSEHDFRLYAPEEELAVCESIYRPMPIGSVLSRLAFIAFLLLSGTGQRVVRHSRRSLRRLRRDVHLPRHILLRAYPQTAAGMILRKAAL